MWYKLDTSKKRLLYSKFSLFLFYIFGIYYVSNFWKRDENEILNSCVFFERIMIYIYIFIFLS